jgi:hypothetical protein
VHECHYKPYNRNKIFNCGKQLQQDVYKPGYVQINYDLWMICVYSNWWQCVTWSIFSSQKVRCNPSQAITSDECNAICPLKGKYRAHLIKQQDTEAHNTINNENFYHTSNNIWYLNMHTDVNRQIYIMCKPME